MKLNNSSISNVLASTLKLGCFVFGVIGLTIAQANASNIALDETENIVPHQATLWSDLG